MSVNLHFLGTGTCALRPNNTSSCYVLDIDGTPVALEMGNGALYRLQAAGYDYRSLEWVLASHAHPDHLSDIMMLFVSLLYTPGFTRSLPLNLTGPASVFEYIDIMQRFYNGAFEPSLFPVQRRVLRPRDTLHTDLFKLTAYGMNHFVDALGYRIECQGRTIAYSGDTDLCPDLDKLCKGADVAILDCSTLHADKAPGHLSARLCGEIAARCGVGTLVLSHRNPQVTGPAATAEVRQAGFEGEICVPDDGRVIVVR